MTREEIETKLKETIVAALDLEDLSPGDIQTDVPLFGEGLGLGLSVSLQFAQMLGGTLTLDKDYTGGSRFVLELPHEDFPT